MPVRLNGTLITLRDGKQYVWSIVEDITKSRQAALAMARERGVEIDALARAPAAFARAAGLSTPMLDMLTAMAIRQARDKGLYPPV